MFLMSNIAPKVTTFLSTYNVFYLNWIQKLISVYHMKDIFIQIGSTYICTVEKVVLVFFEELLSENCIIKGSRNIYFLLKKVIAILR